MITLNFPNNPPLTVSPKEIKSVYSDNLGVRVVLHGHTQPLLVTNDLHELLTDLIPKG